MVVIVLTELSIYLKVNLFEGQFIWQRRQYLGTIPKLKEYATWN